MKKKSWLFIVVLLVICGVVLLARPDDIKDGVTALELGQYEEAIEHFDKQIKKEKQLDEAFLGQGIAYYELGEYNTCIEKFEKALEEGALPEKTTYRFIGNAHMELEQYEDAIEAYTLGIAAEGESPAAVQEMSFNRIVAHERLADWKNAKKLIKEYVKQYPEDEKAQREAEFLETR